VGYPGVPDHVSLWGLLVPIRREFQQYVNLRPVRLMPGVHSPLAGRKPGDIDFWVVRENNEGEYSSLGGRMYGGTEQEFVTQLSVFSRKGTDRIMRYAFELARTRKRKHVTSATKSNGIAITMPYWDERFKEAGLPIIGDDIKSQVGATIVHRQLARLFHERGVEMQHTSQLNVGGNMDFFNMLERERLDSKKISKTNAVTSIMGMELPEDDVHVGPSDYVPWLTDRKWAHIRLEGKSFGDVPLNVELKLEVWDSPNSAGVVIDAVRLIKLALNNGIAGQLDGAQERDFCTIMRGNVSVLLRVGRNHNGRKDATLRGPCDGVSDQRVPGQGADVLVRDSLRACPCRDQGDGSGSGFFHQVVLELFGIDIDIDVLQFGINVEGFCARLA